MSSAQNLILRFSYLSLSRILRFECLCAPVLRRMLLSFQSFVSLLSVRHTYLGCYLRDYSCFLIHVLRVPDQYQFSSFICTVTFCYFSPVPLSPSPLLPRPSSSIPCIQAPMRSRLAPWNQHKYGHKNTQRFWSLCYNRFSKIILVIPAWNRRSSFSQLK